jgi:hypothetical protein
MIYLIKNYENDNEKQIVNIINDSAINDKFIFFINTNSKIEKIVNILPPKFDDYADISNNNNLLILYNTHLHKVIYRNITNDYILIIIDHKLFIFINNINKKLINLIKKFIKLVNNNSINISEIFLNFCNNELQNYLLMLTNNINIIT